MKKQPWLILAGLTTVLSLITLAGLFVWQPCAGTVATAAGGTVPMKCHWTFRAEIPVAIVLVLTAAGQFFLKDTEARRLSAVFIMAVAAVGYVLTTNTVIGICSMPMACHAAANFCRIMLALIVIVAVLQLLKAGAGSRHKREY